MYTSFHIKNFRCFEDLEFNDLARINLIGSKSNVGKTALLEGLFIYGNPFDPPQILNIYFIHLRNHFRDEVDKYERTIWDFLFYDFDSSAPILLNASHSEYGSSELKITVSFDIDETYQKSNIYPTLNYGLRYYDGQTYQITLYPDGKVSYVFPPPYHIASVFGVRHYSFNDITSFFDVSDKVKILEQVLQIIEPRIKHLSLQIQNNQPFIVADIGLSQLISLTLMGEGIVRVAKTIITMGNQNRSVILIDGIENGLDYSTQVDVWKGIYKAARIFNVQVFATTHSLEIIRAAHKAFAENGSYDFRYHRLDRDPESGQISAMTYDEDLMEASTDFSYEVR